MTEMKFTDAATLQGTRKTADGYLVTEAFAVRTGIQYYAGAEVGLMDRSVVRVWRPEDEVRKPASLATFSHAPVTMGHPSDGVTTDNWAHLAKGEVSTEATWDGNKIKLPLIVKDALAIAAIEGGTRELSAGYTCELEFADGFTPEGEAYDAIQRNIRINHLAIVPQGRAGAECRIGDGAQATWGASPCNYRKDAIMANDANTRTVLIDGLSVVTTDAGAQALEKLQGTIAAKDKAISDAAETHATAITAKDEEIGTLKADKKKLEDAAITPEKMTKLIADRVALEATVKAVSDAIKVDGLSDADLRKAAVAAKLGDDMVADASDAEISGMFRAIAKDAAKPVDTFADGVKDKSVKVPSLDAAYAERNAGLSDAWKSPVKKEA